MNISELEDFVQLMIEEHSDYKNLIIDLYRLCSDKIINSIINNDINFSKDDEIETCINSIKELVNANRRTHNRNMIWTTKEGKRAKIRDMSSDHLVNVLAYIDKNIVAYELRWSKKKIKETKHNIKQEVRLRKLNRIEISSNEESLF